MVRIAVDAMGGDFAPGPIVDGTFDAARELSDVGRWFLVGNEDAIRTEFSRHASVPDNIEILHASEVVEMHDSPATAVRRKKDSSIVRAVDLVRKDEADVVFSAGNTGAAVSATTLKLRTLKGISRPAIAAVLPTHKNPFVLLDAGATPDSTADMLVDFAVMGGVYSREILHQPNPRIGMLSIGEEDAKGNEVTKIASQKLVNSGLNFVGNIEAGDLYDSKVDVAVCDGFVGNVVLKTSESTARAMGAWIKKELTRNPIYALGALLSRGAFRAIWEKADPAKYGGAPLLGVNGVCIIGHGSSNRKAVTNALRVAYESVSHHINPQIIETIAKIRASS